MTTRYSVFIATSLDGFIARKDGALDWLPGSDGTPVDEDVGYQEFFDSVDTLVMGRNTWELVLEFGEWPYQGKRVLILSSKYGAEAVPLAHGAEGLSRSPQELALLLEASGARHVYVDGGKTIQGFLRAGLIDDMIITRVPVLLGEGIPLFDELGKDVKLEHQATKSFANGFVQSSYAVLKSRG